MKFERQYFNLLVNDWEVSEHVKSAFRVTDRGLFVPGNIIPETSKRIYEDLIIQIAKTSSMSQPSVVARMTHDLDVHPGQRVLEIGTASGYQAGIIAHMVGHEGRVYTIEADQALAQCATSRLDRLGYKNVEVHHGNGLVGLPEQAPFDRIIITASARSISQQWTNQLKEGGTIVVPVGFDPLQANLIEAKKVAEDQPLEQKKGLSVRFYPLQGDEEGGFSRIYQQTLTRAKFNHIAEYAMRVGMKPNDYIILQTKNSEVSLADFIDRIVISEERFIELSIKYDSE